MKTAGALAACTRGCELSRLALVGVSWRLDRRLGLDGDSGPRALLDGVSWLNLWPGLDEKVSLLFTRWPELELDLRTVSIR